MQGIRVIEAANWLAAPSGCALMADLGANVIKVEPPSGDPFRGLTFGWLDPNLPLNYPFQLDNRGKRSITVDLNHAEGPALLRKLTAGADLFVTNLLPRRQERYGLTYETLRELYPGMVYLAVSGYGAMGLDHNRPGFDYAAFWARSGIMGLMGDPGTPPPMQRPGMGDHSTSINVLAAALAGLRRRDHSGKGLRVDVSLYGTGLWVLGSDLASALVARKNPPRYSRDTPFNPMWNTYVTRDDRWLLLVMPQPDAYWPRFCRAMGVPEWTGDPRYDSREKRMHRCVELVQALDAIFAERGLDQWKERLDQEQLIWAPVLELPQVIEDPQVRFMKHIRILQHPDAGSFATLDTPFRIVDSDIGPRGPAPEIGQHTEEVLLEADFDWEAIATLRDSGVLG